ncbi:MAG TPA: hypothetical protein VHV77_04130, partial [Pirellulales bacterium]|nr:hypothetical protein [Pirellulales bacterium]
MRERTRSLSSKALVLLLMFASGCVALVLQVTWMRELRLVFGATTASVAAVLAIFMGGIGAGSAFFGKRADASANPLRMYGLLEVAIAVTAIVSPWLIQMGSALYYCLGGQESLGVVSATIVRLLLAIVVMAIPTFLMGGTLPAAVRFATQSDDKQRAMLGLLYGSNTLGAVFGVAITTGYSLEILGTRATIWAGCVVGSCAGIVAIVFARYLPPPKEAADRSTPPKTSTSDAAVQSCDESPHELSISHALIYFAAAVLGGTFFALELVWYRMLGPILGGTAFTFGLILCVVLFGIGLGSIAYNFLFRRIQPSWSALSIVCGAEAAVAIVPYMVGDRIAFLAAWYTPTGVDFAARAMGWLFVASLVVLPVALVSGVQFPLLVAMLGQGREQVSSHVGRVYAWNTLGAIVGSLFAGFGGLPLLSAPGMWLGIAVLLSALSFVLLLRAPHITVKTIVPVTALALVTVNAIFMQGPTAAWRRGASGLGALTSQQLSQPNTVEASLREIRHGTILETDGIESSVQLANVNGLAFFVGGKCDGNALTDSATQVGMAILGAVLHDHPKTALVIGLGTGESAGWLAEMPGIEHVDVV